MRRSSKRKSATPSSTSTSSGREADDSQPSRSKSPDRLGNPLNPILYTRLQEKEDLQNLNDRLVNCLEQVRRLEAEKSRVARDVERNETITYEVKGITSKYDIELAEVRKLSDETARERAKLEIEATRLGEENNDLKRR
jgi:lamin B